MSSHLEQEHLTVKQVMLVKHATIPTATIPTADHVVAAAQGEKNPGLQLMFTPSNIKKWVE